MNAIVPFSFDSHQVRVVEHDGEILFVARDVATALGYTNTREAIIDNCKKAKSLKDIGVAGGYPFADQSLTLDLQTKLIPESDVFRLVMRSKLEGAELFQDWVCEEVLPAIRKTGSYTAPKSKKPRRSVGAVVQAKVALLLHREMVLIGVEPNLSLATTMKAVEDVVGFSTEGMRKALSVEPANIASLNQTQLGEKVGLSSREIGKRLRDKGLLTTNARGERLLTDSGKAYGAMVPFSKNGHSSYEPRWFESVLPVIAPDMKEAS